MNITLELFLFEEKKLTQGTQLPHQSRDLGGRILNSSMAFIFNKFQQAIKVLAKSPTFARDPRKLQFEADINRLFLYTSYNRLGRDANEADVNEIVDMAEKASFEDQQQQVQENIHTQVQSFCTSMDEILLPDTSKQSDELQSSPQSNTTPRRSGLSFAIGGKGPEPDHPAVPKTNALTRDELSQRLKDLIGYTLDVKPSQIPHKDAGQGLFLNGEAEVGSVIAFYPGVIYSPAYYQYIPGYPRVNAQNPYLITRYDGNVINAQPWGSGGETREVWDGLKMPYTNADSPVIEKGQDRVWKMLSKPLKGAQTQISRSGREVLERRNPYALAHFANHPVKDTIPNVMICSYDFPLTERDMRVYIPNVLFGKAEEVSMKRFGSFWFKSWSSKKNKENIVPVLKTLVLVATRAVCNEEVLLNYRLSSLKRRPSWYTPVDEEEDRRRWG